jgi:glucose-6-phosphate isomerase
MDGEVAPFGAEVDRATGVIEPTGVVSERRVSDMARLYEDESFRTEMVDSGDPLVYRVVAAPVPEAAGEVPFSITTIEPGTVGEEFFMTKGHAHVEREGELYVGLAGKGLLLLYDGEEACWVEIEPGKAGYIPPGWAHRTVNVGEEPFRFLAVYPGVAGHDYGFVAQRGMGVRVLRSEDGYRVVESKTVGADA